MTTLSHPRRFDDGDHDGVPDEPPQLPFDHDFDPAELEDSQPTDADLAWHAAQWAEGGVA